ncbi:MAG: hypothetical protein IJU76_06510 [Desulfovibrionaceae bacterium]|nr:hypothetical protein [Desulfovibrionaceae bacterium]
MPEKGEELGLSEERIAIRDGTWDQPWPVPYEGVGNMVELCLPCGRWHSVIGECGWLGRSAEVVAREVCKRAIEFLTSGAPVEACLSDQLLVPLALAGGGTFAQKD